MIKNIILDIGDVLVKSDYSRFFAGKGCDEETIKRLEAATFFSPVWKELDRGEWDFSRIIEGFIENDHGLEEKFRTIFNDMSGFITAFLYAKEWISELKKSGLKVYRLSNISDKICRDCAKELEFLEITDGYVLSYRERLIKPNPEIYRLTLERYGLKTEESIFIDDIEQNVKAAKELHIHGIVFKDKKQAEKEIERIRRAEK